MDEIVSNTAAGSSISWTQLEPGDLACERRSIDLGTMVLGYQQHGAALKGDGAVRDGCSFFTFTAGPVEIARWNGLELTRDDVASTRSRFDLYAGPRASFYTLSFRDEDLGTERRGTVVKTRSSLRDVPAEPSVTRSAHTRNLRSYVGALFREGLRPGRRATTTAREDLLWYLAAAVGDGGETVRPSRSQSRRIEAVRLCQNYIESRMGEPVTLLDLSTVCGLRPRSLINAFEAVTSTSPMAYLRAQRLGRVRQMLQSARLTKARIIDVAADWGFWHMGHFAAAYRLMYAETPSETLIRALKGA